MKSALPDIDVWQRHVMALDDVTQRLERITTALRNEQVRFALVGGHAVAAWVATVDPAAVRTTKDVDLLVQRADLHVVRRAALAAEMDYFEVLGVGMLLDRANPHPRHAVHLVWAGEKVRPHYPYASPTLDDVQFLPGDRPVVSLLGLVQMKLMSGRDQDRVHLRDMIEVGLVTREHLGTLPVDLAKRLEPLLEELGR